MVVMSMVFKDDSSLFGMGADFWLQFQCCRTTWKIESISKTTSGDTKLRSLSAKLRSRLRASLVNHLL